MVACMSEGGSRKGSAFSGWVGWLVLSAADSVMDLYMDLPALNPWWTKVRPIISGTNSPAYTAE